MGAIWQMQHVVVEPVRFAPQLDTLIAEVIHGIGDVDKMLPELAGDIFIRWVLACQL